MSYSKIDINKIVKQMGFEGLKPMQKEVLEASVKHNEMLILAPTGSGKTLAFLLPLFQKLNPEVHEVQSVILAPTRELALQIEQVFKQLKTGFKVLTCYGGHPFSRERQSFKHPPALIIATPGRLLDHLQRETFSTAQIKNLVIDEYDKCLELGFSAEMQKILYLFPHIKNTTLTSATAINELPKFFRMKEPKEVNYLDTDFTPDLSYHYLKMNFEEKLPQLETLLRSFSNEPSIVFCNFKNDIQAVSDFLFDVRLPHSTFYGDLDQEEREKSLLKFRNGSNYVLLATDLAARGLDIPEIKNIIHFQIPSKEDTFIHRNGRTARMHASGKVFLLLMENKTLPEYMTVPIEAYRVGEVVVEEIKPEFTTLYLSAGKMHKISKIDVLGFVCQVGGIDKKDVGIIEIKDRASFVAVKAELAKQVLDRCDQGKLKKVKVAADYA
jgi:ATP-independent RNA helicase DbpA